MSDRLDSNRTIISVRDPRLRGNVSDSSVGDRPMSPNVTTGSGTEKRICSVFVNMKNTSLPNGTTFEHKPFVNGQQSVEKETSFGGTHNLEHQPYPSYDSGSLSSSHAKPVNGSDFKVTADCETNSLDSDGVSVACSDQSNPSMTRKSSRKIGVYQLPTLDKRLPDENPVAERDCSVRDNLGDQGKDRENIESLRDAEMWDNASESKDLGHLHPLKDVMSEVYDGNSLSHSYSTLQPSETNGNDDNTRANSTNSSNNIDIIIDDSECTDKPHSLSKYYEKRSNPLKGARKLSPDPTIPQQRYTHIGARKISQHSRKISTGSDMSVGGISNYSNHANVVPTRKKSMVMIDQIPQIIHDSLQSYFIQNASDQSSIPEEDDQEVQYLRPIPKPHRMSVFSTCSRGSLQSDVTFWDPQESLPHVDHYGNSLSVAGWGGYRPRPTLYELREEPESLANTNKALGSDLHDINSMEQKESEAKPKTAQKMGWIQGVLIRCLLNIFGVMLFLRLTWMTGQAGIGLASVIVLLSSLVTSLTTMSMAAICTNGEVRGGGAYFMISRSLGPEFGGAIGVIFSLANAVGAAMHVVGFAETLRDLIKEYGGAITGDALHDVRVIGCLTSLLLLLVVIIGLDFEAKAQLVLLVILLVSLANYFVGTFLPASEEERRLGFVGYQGDLLVNNIGPDFRESDGIDYSFFKVFAIFFPSATGILAGANISGDLKNPSTAIPRGTFLAILVTTIVYLAIVWTSGSCMLRDAIGNVAPLAANVTISLEEIQTCGNSSCLFGLHNSHAIMGVASAFQPLIYAGIFSATLSSALASLVSAPKVFQALGKDKLFPFIGFFSKGYGKGSEPRRGYILAFLICAGITCIGSLDAIAPIISNFFLMSYALVNYSCFDTAFANSPGFRPSFRLFNHWLSLAGALICLVIMFLLSWWAALLTVVAVVALYMYIKHKKPDVNWGSSGQAHAYNDALKSTLKLLGVVEHVKNFRPQILLLSGFPGNRPALVDLAATITKRQSLLICAHIFQGDMQQHARHLRSTAAYGWLRNRGVHAFYTTVAAPTLRHGTQALLQSQGLGKLRPNVLLLGFKVNWQVVDPRTVHNYVGIIHDAFDLCFGVGILRVPGELDIHKFSDASLDTEEDILEDADQTLHSSDEETSDEHENETKDEPVQTNNTFSNDIQKTSTTALDALRPKHIFNLDGGITNNAYQSDSDSEPTNLSGEIADDTSDTPSKERAEVKSNDSDKVLNDLAREKSGVLKNDMSIRNSPDVTTQEKKQDDRLSGLENSNWQTTKETKLEDIFRTKQTGTIDVWWVFDDGGLGLLVPYLLSTRKKWSRCKLRIFCAGTKKSNLEFEQRQMAALLSKFRIDYSEITVVPELRLKPSKSSYKEFQETISSWRLQPGETQDDYPWKISDADLVSRKEKIYMQLKIREMMKEYSKDAALIVASLPVPRKLCPAGLYMAWLDTLTRDMPPTLLLRGNQQNVLTYFS